MTQSKALEILKSGENVFLTGEAGSGKSYTIGKFIEHLDFEGIDYAVTASTGIAASHIGGHTIHSWSGLGIRKGLTKKDLAILMRNKYVVDRIKHTDVLIIDEISMLDAQALDDIDNILREVHSKYEPFGGLQIVLVGDFYQLPPVTKGEDETMFAFESNAWINGGLKVCYLTEQHRQKGGAFTEVLTAMRNNAVDDHHINLLNENGQSDTPPETRLFTHNVNVDQLNEQKLDEIDAKPHHYQMTSGGIPFMVDRLKKSCLSPENLTLKKGAVVMFTRNSPSQGFVNGTIGKVVGFTSSGKPKVQVGEQVIIPDRAEWSFEENYKTLAYIKQYPLRLAWAVTVHKSQGMSLDSARIDLSRVFEFGQGYVAISRLTSLDGLHLDSHVTTDTFKMHPKVIEADKLFRAEANQY